MTGGYATAFFDEERGPDDADDDLPPGLDDGALRALGLFAWAYVKGLGALVMGVVDGLARGVGDGGAGEAGGVRLGTGGRRRGRM